MEGITDLSKLDIAVGSGSPAEAALAAPAPTAAPAPAAAPLMFLLLLLLPSLLLSPTLLLHPRLSKDLALHEPAFELPPPPPLDPNNLLSAFPIVLETPDAILLAAPVRALLPAAPAAASPATDAESCSKKEVGSPTGEIGSDPAPPAVSAAPSPIVPGLPFDGSGLKKLGSSIPVSK